MIHDGCQGFHTSNILMGITQHVSKVRSHVGIEDSITTVVCALVSMSSLYVMGDPPSFRVANRVFRTRYRPND